jgi:hypothetical protein
MGLLWPEHALHRNAIQRIASPASVDPCAPRPLERDPTQCMPGYGDKGPSHRDRWNAIQRDPTQCISNYGNKGPMAHVERKRAARAILWNAFHRVPMDLELSVWGEITLAP